MCILTNLGQYEVHFDEATEHCGGKNFIDACVAQRPKQQPLVLPGLLFSSTLHDYAASVTHVLSVLTPFS